jgi:hypothetical protein
VLYDLRSGLSLPRLSGHLDAAVCVAFNPLYPQLCSGSYDGSLAFFTHDTLSHGDP